MSTKKNKPPLKLEMDFNEALHRFANTDPKEVKKEPSKKTLRSKRNINPLT